MTSGDNDFVEESKYVSGVHVERVFSEDHETAQRFCDKYELGSCWNSYDEFLADVDIVYIKTSLNRRAEYIERALKKGKYVISDSPMTTFLRETALPVSGGKGEQCGSH